MTQTTPSLNDQIAEAGSIRELEQLLALGSSDKYRFATQRTRNRWQRTAMRRRQQLQQPRADHRSNSVALIE